MATGGVAEADLKKAQSNVLGSEQSGVEPPSGIQGRGTADEPYDQGNQPAQATGPGVEPPSGQQGKGTIDQPYDQGNQPDQNAENAPMSIVDQLSRTRTKEEVASKNQRRKISQAGIEQVKTNGTTVPPPQPPPPTTIKTEPPRGRDETRSTTVASAPKDVDTTKLAPKPSRAFERSVSPGTLDDGSHVPCGGEKGEAYSPPSNVGAKIMGKLHIGKH